MNTVLKVAAGIGLAGLVVLAVKMLWDRCRETAEM